MSLLAINTPELSQELLDELDRTFAQLEIVPNVTTLDEIMYNAGQREVVRWLTAKTRRRTITGQSL